MEHVPNLMNRHAADARLWVGLSTQDSHFQSLPSFATHY